MHLYSFFDSRNRSAYIGPMLVCDSPQIRVKSAVSRDAALHCVSRGPGWIGKATSKETEETIFTAL